MVEAALHSRSWIWPLSVAGRASMKDGEFEEKNQNGKISSSEIFPESMMWRKPHLQKPHTKSKDQKDPNKKMIAMIKNLEKEIDETRTENERLAKAQIDTTREMTLTISNLEKELNKSREENERLRLRQAPASEKDLKIASLYSIVDELREEIAKSREMVLQMEHDHEAKLEESEKKMEEDQDGLLKEIDNLHIIISAIKQKQ